ncbi:MAG: two-component regulator propeller domain-containing protein [Bacteroidales bacterium]|nr:two-component regulator propeller domain-containing protein [Bacteroidales bacterium]
MNHLRPLFFCLCFYLGFALSGTAQVGKFYSTDKEISNSLINKVYQDRKGFVWIATEDGLNRFDGLRFTMYRNSAGDSTSLKNNYVRAVYEDTQNRFWVGCINGLLLYDRAKDLFREVEVYQNEKRIFPLITSILESTNGDIWIATSGYGLLSIRKGSDSCLVESKLNPRLCSVTLTTLMEDSDHRLWIASDNRGLSIYTPATDEVRTLSAPGELTDGNVVALCEDGRGNVYIGTLGGLNVMEPALQKVRSVRYGNGWARLRIQSMLLNNRGELIIGTDGQGVKRYLPGDEVVGEYEVETDLFDFSKTKVHALLEDKAGNLWLGLFQKGVYFIPGNANTFGYLGYRSLKQNTIGSSCVTSVCKDSEQTTWVGTDNDGLYAILAKDGKVLHHPLPLDDASVSNTIMSVLEDSRRSLWLGSYINGLIRFDRKTQTCTYAKDLFPDRHDIPDEYVSCIAEDGAGHLWIGTYGKGAFQLDLATNRLTHLPVVAQSAPGRKGLPGGWINCILPDSEGAIWFGTFDGACRYSPASDSYQYYKWSKDQLPGMVVYSILEDSSHRIWFGTSEGLACLDNQGKMTQYTVKDGLPNNVICAMLEDDRKNIWLSTHYGLSRLTPDEKKFVNFFAFDGLQSNEFYRGARFKGSDGTLFFGGIKGITFFNPQKIIDKRTPLDVCITHFYRFEKSVREGDRSGGKPIITKAVMDEDRFVLSFSDNAFSFELSTLDFNNAERIYYEYQMEGLGTEWIRMQPGMNRATFTNLSPGTYAFRFRACLNDVVSATREVEVVIIPPWYRSWWAYCLYLLLVGLFVAAVAQYILARFRNRRERMKQESERQISEAKLQFFTNISHEIRTPMTLIIAPLEKLLAEKNNPDKQKDYLLMYRTARRILQLINQLLDVRKLDKGQMRLRFGETDIIRFIEELLMTFEYQASRKKITLSFVHEEKELKAWIDLNNFDKIIFNILANAFKFTPENGAITVELSSGLDPEADGPLKRYVEIVISDTGIGLDADKLEKIFERYYQIDNPLTGSHFGTGIGLHLARSLAELHQGTLHAENRKEGTGARFVLRLPLGCAHLSTEQIETALEAEEALSGRLSVYQTEFAQRENEAKGAPTKENRSKRKGYRVLIVEDEEDIRRYVSGELSRDYKVLECVNGKEGLETALREKPDLIISDVMMPEMDGITLCRKLKQNINISDIPVILLTARSSVEDQVEGLQTGADAYVAKPFNMDVLRMTVHNLIESRGRLKTKFSGREAQEEKIEKVELKSSDEILLAKVMKVINQNLSDPNLNVEKLAEEVGISRVHMHRKLKELTNQSARDFIRGVRLRQAASLLAGKKQSVSEVAYATGFSSLSHFSTSFHDFFGQSPKEYAETHIADQIADDK